MLRVRPTFRTADTDRAAALLTALGMVPAGTAAGGLLFDAGGGRIALVPADTAEADDGDAVLGFEVGDLEVFARRTAESGTPAKVVSHPDGDRSVRVLSPLLSFTVHQGERLLRPGANAHLTVACTWSTPDPVAAAKAMTDIGARPREASPAPVSAAGSAAPGEEDFQAKNGGLVAVRRGTQHHVELGFEYDREMSELFHRVRAAGIVADLSETDACRTLSVSLRSGQLLRVWDRPAKPADRPYGQ